jgi:hypothetical protein
MLGTTERLHNLWLLERYSAPQLVRGNGTSVLWFYPAPSSLMLPLKDKTELATTIKNKNIKDIYRGINK